MSMKLYPSSEKMHIDKRIEAAKYPWRTMAIGMSFSIAIDEIGYRTLQNYASKMGKSLGRRFKVVMHSENMCYEVGYISERTVKKPTIEPITAAVEPQFKSSQWELPKEGEPTGAEKFKKMGF